MKLATWAATAVLSTALIVTPTAAFAAPTSASSDSPETSSECNFGQRVMQVWRQLPVELQADLKELRSLDPSERRDAAIELREQALEGAYGPEVQERVELRKDRRALALSTMPIELKHALLDLRNAEPGERGELAKEIANDALAGVYGPHAQETVERIQETEFWQACLAD